MINFRKYLFFYRDGYYELPYLSNSPQIMLASFKRMPFVKVDEENKCIKTNNPFTDGVMYYEELEEGLWIMITEMEFKKNISTHALYDQDPCDYYFLSYFRYTHKPKDVRVNEVTVPHEGWGLYRPGTQVNAYFSENDKGIFMDIAFSNDWFDKNIKFNNTGEQRILKEYIASNISYKVWKDLVKDAAPVADEILSCLKMGKTSNSSHLTLKINCLNLMNGFFSAIVKSDLKEEVKKINENDRMQIANVERLLLDALYGKFPGIEVLAKTAHMSPTKLKNLFRLEYDNTMLQYYQEKQMILALSLLKDGKISIKEVANNLGYDNPSNFTLAFKKYHNFLPSEIE